MPELLLELFSEEIPARMQKKAAADLERLVNERLLAAGFLPEGVKAFSGPRRLTLIATGLPLRQPDRTEEKKGPRVGAPEKAVEGFLKSAGLSSLKDCAIEEDKKGQFYVARVEKKGRETAAVIAEAVPDIVRDFPWPKSMRWGDGDLRWVRPLHSILCCFDNEVVPFAVDGVSSGDETRGHRRAAPEPIRARNFDSYVPALTGAKVMLDGRAREELIAGDAKTLCEAQGLELVEDGGLLAEVAGLVEWPVVMIGAFDEKFLVLPDEVLASAMRKHQKYFSVKDPKTGRLAARFVFVANLDAPDAGKAMRKGYERVLAARLADAWYLYHQDLKAWSARKSVDEFLEPLSRVTFFEGLGTLADKARRVAALAKEIAPAVGADPALAEKAALLAKADLVTGMVGEFPDLQGVMGRYYYLATSSADGAPPPSPVLHGRGVGGEGSSIKSASLAAGPSPLTPLPRAGEGDVADAIRDHYKPQGANDDVPTAPVSVAVALADRIDTLTAFWAIGKKPTGSGDPYALRRAALAVIANLLEPNPAHSGASRNPGRRQDWVPAFAGMSGLKTNRLPLASILNRHLLRHVEFEFSGHGLRTLVEAGAGFQGGGFGDPDALKIAGRDLSREICAFFHDRLKVYLRDKGHRHDRIDAVLATPDGALEDDLVLIVMKLEALEAFLETDDGANLAAAYKRAGNILKAEGVGRMQSAGGIAAESRAADFIRPTVEEKLFKQAEERALFAALKTAETKAEKSVAAEKFEDAMAALSTLRAPIDAFFDKVTVNADDRLLRANRLALLSRFTAATATVADLSKLEG